MTCLPEIQSCFMLGIEDHENIYSSYCTLDESKQICKNEATNNIFFVCENNNNAFSLCASINTLNSNAIFSKQDENNLEDEGIETAVVSIITSIALLFIFKSALAKPKPCFSIIESADILINGYNSKYEWRT